MKRRFITFEAGMTVEAAGSRKTGEEEIMKGLKGGNKFTVLKKKKRSLSAIVRLFSPEAKAVKIQKCFYKRNYK